MEQHRTNVYVLILVLAVLPALQRAFTDLSPVQFGARLVILLLIAYELWFQQAWTRRARRKKLAKTFAITFGEAAAPSRMAPVNECEHLVNIQFNELVPLEQFHLRFVPMDGGVVPPEVVRIDCVENHLALPSSLSDFAAVMCEPDGKGGCKVFVTDDRRKRVPLFHKGEVLRLKMSACAVRPWAGYLSLRGYDEDHCQVFARGPFCFI